MSLQVVESDASTLLTKTCSPPALTDSAIAQESRENSVTPEPSSPEINSEILPVIADLPADIKGEGSYGSPVPLESHDAGSSRQFTPVEQQEDHKEQHEEQLESVTGAKFVHGTPQSHSEYLSSYEQLTPSKRLLFRLI